MFSWLKLNIELMQVLTILKLRSLRQQPPLQSQQNPT